MHIAIKDAVEKLRRAEKINDYTRLIYESCYHVRIKICIWEAVGYIVFNHKRLAFFFFPWHKGLDFLVCFGAGL